MEIIQRNVGDWKIKSDLRYLGGRNITPPLISRKNKLGGPNLSQMFVLLYQITLFQQLNAVEQTVAECQYAKREGIA